MHDDAKYVTARLSGRFWDLIELSRTSWEQFEAALENFDALDRKRLYWTYREAKNVLRAGEHEDFMSPTQQWIGDVGFMRGVVSAHRLSRRDAQRRRLHRRRARRRAVRRRSAAP